MRIPIGVDAGFSRSRGFWARRIMSATNAFWCHTFIRFRFSDGSDRIFESRIQTGGFAESDPASYDLAALEEAGIETPLQDVALVPICNDARGIEEALRLCEQWRGVKTYPIHQLTAIWLSHRYGIPVPRSANALICSEALAVIAHQVGVDLRDIWHPTWDSVTPGSAWNNLMAIRAGYGQQIRRNKEVRLCAGSSKYYALRPWRP